MTVEIFFLKFGLIIVCKKKSYYFTINVLLNFKANCTDHFLNV